MAEVKVHSLPFSADELVQRLNQVETNTETLTEQVRNLADNTTADAQFKNEVAETYAKKTELPDVTGFITEGDLAEYAKKSELPESPDLSEYAKKNELPDVTGFITEDNLAEYAKKNELPDLTEYAKKNELPDVTGFITEGDLTDYAKKSELPDLAEYAKKSELPDLAEYAKKNELPDVTGFITEDNLAEYAKKSELPDLAEYAKKNELPDVTNFITEDDLTDYAKKNELPDVTGFITEDDLTEYAKKNELPDVTGFITEDNLAEYAKKSELPDVTGFITEDALAQQGYLTEADLADDFAAINGSIDELYSKLDANESADAQTSLQIIALRDEILNRLQPLESDDSSDDEKIDDLYGKIAVLENYVNTDTIDDAEVEAAVANIRAELQNYDFDDLVSKVDVLSSIDHTQYVSATQYNILNSNYNQLAANYVALQKMIVSDDPSKATVMNPMIVNSTLQYTNSVTIDNGELTGCVTVPASNNDLTITAPISEDGMNVTSYTTNKVTIKNNGNTTPNVTFAAPNNANGMSMVGLMGNYGDVTIKNASITSGGLFATGSSVSVDNVNITGVAATQNNPVSIRTTFTGTAENPSYITTTGSTGKYVKNIELSNMNDVAPSAYIVTPNSTVTLQNSWDNVEAYVSANTLVLDPFAHVNSIKCNANVFINTFEENISEICDNIDAPSFTYITEKTEVTEDNKNNIVPSNPEVSKYYNFNEDLEYTSQVVIPISPRKDIVWNINSAITTNISSNADAFILTKGGRLNVRGTGSITTNKFVLMLDNTSVVVNIYDGNFTGRGDAMYVNTGKLNIYGGTFMVSDANTQEKDVNGNVKYLLNCTDKNYNNGKAVITVYGGKFYDFDPSNSYGEQNGPVSFVAEGYGVVEGNDERGHYYEVRPTNEING